MTEKVRKTRMAWLVKMLENAEPPVEIKKFVAIGSYNLGLSVEKICEYLKVLEDMEVLEIDVGKGVLKWKRKK